MTYTVPSTTIAVAGRAVTKQFVSAVETGTGAQQSIAHGLGRTPEQVLIILTLVPLADVAAAFSVVQSAAPDATNVYVTATSGVEYQVFAISSPRGLLASGVD